MSQLLFDLTIGAMSRSLGNLDAILTKAEAHAEADDNLDPATLLQARLYPNMRPLVFQVQVATDTAKGAAARLSGQEPPSWPDEEVTFADLHARIAKALDYLKGFGAADLEGGEDRPIQLKLGPTTVDFTGRTYVANFVLPNFLFHVATAHGILRSCGVVIGKRDFLGAA